MSGKLSGFLTEIVKIHKFSLPTKKNADVIKTSLVSTPPF